MRIYFSGGGSPWIPEMQLPDGMVMLSYYTNAKQGKPDVRLRKAMKAVKRRKQKEKRNGS